MDAVHFRVIECTKGKQTSSLWFRPRDILVQNILDRRQDGRWTRETCHPEEWTGVGPPRFSGEGKQTHTGWGRDESDSGDGWEH